MIKYIAFSCALFVMSVGGHAQTLRVKCNSIQSLQVAVSGVNAAGKHKSAHITNLSHDQWRTISLNSVATGYDEYNNAEMQHQSNDSTWKWSMLYVYTTGAEAYDSLDLTKPVKNVHMNHAGLLGKVKIAYDRRYMITEVTLTDE